ncbi:hypothetical protein TSAR_000864 [Trichomalopsis sarcophagae]|uniref:Uncharacterized protein n=1 Tax=Trichomalopsis sarcophagae TaxID=543379 RepID=A0A232ESM6_9HYME|nr:hypothetical protein TSAR_000864 [Trichomalopsis sarcophagae]
MNENQENATFCLEAQFKNVKNECVGPKLSRHKNGKKSPIFRFFTKISDFSQYYNFPSKSL